MKKKYFITGTDTEVGKTWVSRALLHAFSAQGLQTIALKPVAAGAEETEKGWVNEDALYLQEAATKKLPYSQVNPFLLKAPIAPHIAAEQEKKPLSVARIVGLCRGAAMQSHHVLLIEGAGGWRVPLNSRETLADVAREMGADVILVVGLKLGCINHALLTAEAIRRDGLTIAGWVANQVSPEPMLVMEENIRTLSGAIPAPLLGTIPFQSEGDVAKSSAGLDISLLLEE